MATVTKRVIELTMIQKDGEEALTLKGDTAQGVLLDWEKYMRLGEPKGSAYTDDAGVRHWLNFSCYCDVSVTRSTEDAEGRDCENIDCIPDYPPSED